GTNTVDVANINTALNTGTNVTITTDIGGTEEGNITQNADALINKTAGGDATLTLLAANNIILNGEISSSSGRLNVALTADADNSGAGAIDMANATIFTNGGNVTGIGRGNPTAGDSISLNNSNINAGGGNVELTGIGQDDGFSNHRGIFLANSVVETSGTGTITLTGTGGNGTNFNQGLLINQSSTVRAVDGNIAIFGTGGNGTGTNNNGIDIAGVVETTGTGTISLTGTGGNGTTFNPGIVLRPSSIVRAVDGNIAMFGTGGNGTGSRNSGIELFGVVETTGTGAISLTGAGGNGTEQNRGIFLPSAAIRATSGNISLTGTGGNGTGADNQGIRISDFSEVSTTNGAINLNGTGGTGTIFNTGVLIESNSRVSSVNGSINLIGQGNGTGDGNYGILVGNRSVVETTGTGNISFEGIGGTGLNTNFGIRIAQIGTRVTSADGNITFTGTSRGTGSDNEGINISSAAAVESTGRGNITLVGTAGNGTNENVGIRLREFAGNASFIRVFNGNINLTGIGNGTGSGNTGVQLDAGSAIASTGVGNISLTGTGVASAGDTSLDIFLTEGSLLQSTGSGNISLAANQNIITDNIITSGGAIAITSDNGSINTSAGILSSASQTADGGAITLQADGDITTGRLDSRVGSTGIGGTITVISTNGAINTTAGAVDSGSIEAGLGNGGNIVLSARGNITTSDVLSRTNSGGTAGNITITSTDGAIDTTAATFGVHAFGSPGGAIALSANGDVRTGSVLTYTNNPPQTEPGGNITITSNNGNIDTSAGLLSSGSQVGDGGAITLSANNGSITTDVLSSLGNNTGGAIALSAAGNITTNAIASSGGNGDGGIININSGGEININNDSSVVGVSGVSSGSLNGNGADILLNAASNIRVGSRPLLSSSAIGNAGNITLNSTSGDIEVAGIQAEGGTGGSGGNVDITTTGFFRATDSFPNLNGTTASITTSGVTGGGSIIIRHGGLGITPFIVGDASTNGTAGAITTGNAFPVQTISPNQEFFNTHTQERIQIISVPGQTLPPPPTLPIGSNRPDIVPQDAIANLIGTLVGAQTTVNQDPLNGNSGYNWTIPGQGSLDTGYINLQNVLAQGNLNQAVSQIDEVFEEEFENYLGEKLPHETVTVEGIRTVLKTINSETKTQPAIVYALSTPQQLELVLVLPDGSPIRKVVPEANAATFQKTLTEFRSSVTNVASSRGYLASAQQLYQWMIAPLESHLEALGIDTLIFCMDAGLRLIPMAALHDGQQFLVEKYSIGSIPSVSLTNSRYKAVKDAQVLGMGASEFQQLAPLPAVPTELQVITQQLGSGQFFLNEGFTLNNLKSQRQPFSIIHLATHADFQPGNADNAYIQLWDSQLKINQLRQMGWYQPPQVELLVLSACRTALGDVDAELGFAGLAVQAGVKSALASLWYVSDEGALALMSGFYQHLRQEDVTIKAEALRRAQLAMLRGQMRVENGQLQGLEQLGSIPLPPELTRRGNNDFSHPYYWAAFTMIGSPW
ncbi:MAG: CHAT domain-containing protein, partial [Cyanobacteriota bacterium]